MLLQNPELRVGFVVFVDGQGITAVGTVIVSANTVVDAHATNRDATPSPASRLTEVPVDSVAPRSHVAPNEGCRQPELCDWSDGSLMSCSDSRRQASSHSPFSPVPFAGAAAPSSLDAEGKTEEDELRRTAACTAWA
eukprot:CAMPEP_0177749450 /NCGR_PEP_ID=MMETSP0484_2-20121128/32494_1 /TAXON_ID=354590 /ORGANISM="Rhodomonas lens, Strain RHODO" /LENGTH=136 /DNA_ID=CAMNT_0019264437 /DNA_START=114 /DNA_END=525 /DNA_ORIENTATION=-